MKNCPYCAELIQDEAIFCRFCKRDLDPAGAQQTTSTSQAVASSAHKMGLSKRVVYPVLAFMLCSVVCGVFALVVKIQRDAAQAKQVVEMTATQQAEETAFAITDELDALAATETEVAQPQQIQVTLINQDCSASDYYVDGKFVVRVEANSTTTFTTTRGQHTSKACRAGDASNCGDTNQHRWANGDQQQINRNTSCDQQAQVTLTNQDCLALDYYVDGKFVVSVEANSTTTFTYTPGQHMSKACLVGDASNCGATINVSWYGDVQQRIGRDSSCDRPQQIQITLINQNCYSQDFYVDGKFIIRVKANSTTTFTTTPGQHTAQACTSRTSDCGERVNVDWDSDVNHTIYRNSSCR